MHCARVVAWGKGWRLAACTATAAATATLQAALERHASRQFGHTVERTRDVPVLPFNHAAQLRRDRGLGNSESGCTRQVRSAGKRLLGRSRPAQLLVWQASHRSLTGISSGSGSGKAKASPSTVQDTCSSAGRGSGGQRKQDSTKRHWQHCAQNVAGQAASCTAKLAVQHGRMFRAFSVKMKPCLSLISLSVAPAALSARSRRSGAAWRGETMCRWSA